MAAFPTLSSGAVSMYPAVLTQGQKTSAMQFVNASELRYRSRQPTVRFTLTFRDISGYDLSLIQDFWRTQKGMYVDAALAGTFSLTLPINGVNTTYNYLVLEQDDLVIQESKPNSFSLQIKMRQVRMN